MSRNNREIIIDRPQVMTKKRRCGEHTTAAIAWILWAFLFRPSLFLALWAFGARIFYVEMIKGESLPDWTIFIKYFVALAGIYTMVRLTDPAHRKIIIDRPQTMAKSRKYGERSTAAIAWLLWAFLLRPVLFLAMWAFGIRVFYIEMIIKGGLLDWTTFIKYFTALAGMYAMLQLWNRYNIMRFRGKKDRRKAGKNVSDTELASLYKILEQDVKHIKEWKQINIHFPEKNKLLFDNNGFGNTPGIEGSYYPNKTIS